MTISGIGWLGAPRWALLRGAVGLRDPTCTGQASWEFPSKVTGADSWWQGRAWPCGLEDTSWGHRLSIQARD